MCVKLIHRIAGQLLLWIAVLVPVLSQAQETEDPTRVLFVGNSYTHYNDMPGLFQKIAESKGEKVITEMDARSSHTFKMHSRRPELFEHIRKSKWDYVVLQGFSRELSFSKEYMDTASVPYFEMILDSVYANNPCTKVLLYMTWGYRIGFAEREEIDSYEKMSDAVRNGYEYLARKYDLAIVPVGDVYRQVKANEDVSLFPCLYQKDDQHPSVFGSYVVANTFYSAIFRNSPINAYHKGISREDAQIVQNMAHSYVEANRDRCGLNNEYFEIDYDWSDKGKLVVNTRASYGMADVVWDFGDGTILKQAVATHVYDELGAYPISLAVQAKCGNSSMIRMIDLNQLPEPEPDNPAASKISGEIRRAKKKQRKDG